MTIDKRKYPIGIQSFESIRKDGYIYVDKTPFIYKMITEGKPYFLSRPRRFGKSLLVSTLAAVFEGRRELFEAFTTEDGIEQPQLFIAQTSWRWDRYPVIRFDFSKDLLGIDELELLIDKTLEDYEQQYGIVPEERNAFLRMDKLIRAAHAQTGRRVVLLVDEYDKMMLHSIGDDKAAKDVRDRFRNLFSPLKSLDDHLQFVFITGISKFSQMGVFSTINQLENISMQPAYESICGISEKELTTLMRTDVEALAAQRGKTFDETFHELKNMYDGYHFSEGMTDMYNPFSLLKALSSGLIKRHWFESATPSSLISMLSQMPPLTIDDVDGVKCESDAFDDAFDNYQAPLPVLYQSGYLTIKEYDSEDDIYTLGFPNQEVRTGFAGSLYRYITNTTTDNRERSALMIAYKAFCRTDDLTAFIEAIKAFYASIPYYWEKDNRNEHFYHALLYTLLVAFGADVRPEEPSAKGRADLTLLMPKHIYIIEIKYDATAQEALDQIDRKGYAEKYRLDGRPITNVGIAFSSEKRNIAQWDHNDTG